MVTLPVVVHPSCLAPLDNSGQLPPPTPERQFGDIHINGCLNFSKAQGKVKSLSVTRGEGFLGYQRAYKWGVG